MTNSNGQEAQGMAAKDSNVLRIGQRVKFTVSSGNDVTKVYSVSARKQYNGQYFYILEGLESGLFLRSSLARTTARK